MTSKRAKLEAKLDALDEEQQHWTNAQMEALAHLARIEDEYESTENEIQAMQNTKRLRKEVKRGALVVRNGKIKIVSKKMKVKGA